MYDVDRILGFHSHGQDLRLSMFCERIKNRVGVTPWKIIYLLFLSINWEFKKYNENKWLLQ